MKNKHLIRIPDWGVTEQIVTFADDFVLSSIPNGSTVLDIGCGQGLFTEEISKKAKQVTGIDMVQREIDIAVRDHKRENITYLCRSAEALGEGDTKFDIVISRYCFHHVDMDQAAPAIKARINPGGRLLAVDCYAGFWSPAGRLFVIKDAIKNMGWIRFLIQAPRFLYFFTPQRVSHVRHDKKRLIQQNRYFFEDVVSFYKQHFPGAQIGKVGCAVYIDWLRN